MSRAAFESLTGKTDALTPRPRGKTQVAMADEVPPQRCALKSLSDDALRDLVAGQLHAALLGRGAYPDEPGACADAAWRAVDEYMRARADWYAERAAAKYCKRGGQP